MEGDMVRGRITHDNQQAANITFDQLSSLPYTDLQVEMDDQ